MIKKSQIEQVTESSDSFKTSLSSTSMLENDLEKAKPKKDGFGDVLRRVLTRRSSLFEENREEVQVSYRKVNFELWLRTVGLESGFLSPVPASS